MKRFLFIAITALLLAACTSGDQATTPPTSEPATDTPAPETTQAASSAEATEEGGGAVEMPSWMTTTLVDVRTGEEFTLADYLGKTVYVGLFDLITPDNLTQLEALKQVAAELSEENVDFVLLEGSPGSMPASRITRFLDNNAVELRAASLTQELRVSLPATFGSRSVAQSLSPHFAIRPDGTWTDLRTRPEAAETMIEWLRAVDKGEQ